jgi:hypothetical protein
MDTIHALTTITGNTSSLRIYVQLYSGEHGYQLYANVSVDTPASGYELHVTVTPRDMSRMFLIWCIVVVERHNLLPNIFVEAKINVGHFESIMCD